jgi:trehalose 6-phosphate synthase/phosphatase
MRLVIISNRLPFTVSVKDGKPRFKQSSGGLTTGLWSYLERQTKDPGKHPDFLWLGWPGTSIAPEHEAAVLKHGEQFRARPVFLPEESVDRFYHGFCNKTIWPLFHYFPTLTRYEEDYWEEYQQVNRAFADALMGVLQPDDIVWVHDYQLMLLPQMIRKQFP